MLSREALSVNELSAHTLYICAYSQPWPCDLGQVFFGLVEPRVRVGIVQDHQR